jgi:hypothetical protein
MKKKFELIKKMKNILFNKKISKNYKMTELIFEISNQKSPENHLKIE